MENSFIEFCINVEIYAKKKNKHLKSSIYMVI